MSLLIVILQDMVMNLRMAIMKICWTIPSLIRPHYLQPKRENSQMLVMVMMVMLVMLMQMKEMVMVMMANQSI